MNTADKLMKDEIIENINVENVDSVDQETKNSDTIFEAFLESGSAELLNPIRPKFAKAVMWNSDTVEISTEGNIEVEINDERYLFLLNDLQNQDEETVQGSRRTRVPSMLTIIQAKSTYSEDEHGLPCYEDELKICGSDDHLLEGIDHIDISIKED